MLIIIFYSTNTQALVFNNYTIGDKIENEVVLDKRITLSLSSGEWEIVEKENWCYYSPYRWTIALVRRWSYCNV